jgi:hypothetical protein
MNNKQQQQYCSGNLMESGILGDQEVDEGQYCSVS